jgi:protein phosphatase
MSVLYSETGSFPFGVFIVADGLGGQRDGQVASELSVRAVASHLIRAVYAPLVAAQVQDSEMPPLNESLAASVESANRAVIHGTKGGGSTLTALVLLDRMVYVIHVGDTRAYVIDTGSLSLLTSDHSLASRLMEVQGSSELDIADSPERHTLYKALGQPTSPEPDIRYHSIAPGSHLLLCSDGLWGFVSERDILEAFRTLDDAQSICTHLAKLAISHGSDDNVSLMALVSRAD